MSTFSFPPILENTEDLIDLIAHAHTAAEATRCIALAACTLFLYDFITTIDDEVKYIWSKEWSVPRVVFHLNRVCPAIVIGVALPGMMIQRISPTSCKNIVLAYSYTSIMVSLNIAVVVVLRCWALYDRKPWVLKFLVSFLMLMILPCVYVVTKQANDNLYPIVTLPEILPGCIVVYSSYAWIPYTFALCFESMVFSMMLHRTYVITQNYGNTRLIWRLMIDGTLYYVAAIAAVIFCLGAAVSDSLRAPVISSGLLVSILSTMCSRMILSLHNFTEQEQLERLGTSGVAPAPVFPSSLKVATSDIYEERFKKLEYERSTDHERTSFKFDGGADDYSEIEMNVLRVSDRIGINV